MKPRFLLDENLTAKIKWQLLRQNPVVEIYRVGEVGMPPLGTLDPEILLFIEQEGLILVTENRTTFPNHLAKHYAQGRHFPGLLWIKPHTTIGQVVASLNLIWEASEAAEYFDRTEFIPF